jgi:hypothetical protein
VYDFSTFNRSGQSTLDGALDVRFGSKADICSAKERVRFTPNSDRESDFPHKVMSALPPIADMCGAVADVRFAPIADTGSVALSLSAHLR